MTACGEPPANRASFWGVLAGVAVLVLPYLLLVLLANDDAARWAPVYLAGAVGGGVLEMIRLAWRLEMPSGPRRATDRPAFARPLGYLLDIGFLGRLATGAIAAPVFLVILNALEASDDQRANLQEHLRVIAGGTETLAWGVLVGFAAPAAWQLGQALVERRIGAAQATLGTTEKAAQRTREGLEKSANGSAPVQRAIGRLEVIEELARRQL